MNCPACGHDNVRYEYDCHTWPGGTRTDGTTQWMHCQNCDSALRYCCHCWLDDEMPDPDNPDGLWISKEPECDCMWDYTHGLNPGNPRAAREEESRPPWLVGDLKFTELGIPIPYPGVRYAYE